ncbi:hypothetical protein HPP92_023228 [Vanilla planifolia]|uniref:Uncharacterized protein n=1 Tax=Vanilla planifolia TaxID=51239 RepID=A0A835PTQ3_VANPL|nr:hypothetical protein HPP92_023228 [Vanilla planifolia]
MGPCRSAVKFREAIVIYSLEIEDSPSKLMLGMGELDVRNPERRIERQVRLRVLVVDSETKRFYNIR